MKAIFKKISTSILVVLLSVSLTFTNTAAVTYQAAAIPVVYSSWQVLVTILALLGITICAAPELEDDAAQELMDAYVRFKVLKGEGQGDSDGDGEDDLFATFDPLDYLTSSNQLYLDQDDLEAWQNFYYEYMAEPVQYKPSDSSVDLYGCTYQEYVDFFVNYYGIDSLHSGLNNLLSKSFVKFVENDYTGIFLYDYDYFYDSSFDYSQYDFFYFLNFPYSSSYYGYRLMNYESDSQIYLTYNTKYNPVNYVYRYAAYYRSDVGGRYDYYAAPVKVNFEEDNFIIVRGQFYSFNDVFSIPDNVTSSNDFGNIVQVSDFVRSTNNLGSSLTDVVNTVSGLDLSNLLADQSFDVIGSGREYNEDTGQAEGDIVVPMPSPGSIADYQTGDLSYEDLLEEMEVTPIDESTGTDLLTGEFLTIQTGIFSGVNSIVGILQNIWAWLNNLIDSIVQAFIDMLMSLFVPSDGFIDGKIGLITAKLDSLGVAPYDMSGIFDSDDGNPFQNIVIDVNGQEVVIVSFDYLPPFLNKFRPVIRGLLVLFLIYYSINQLLSLIRLSGMMEGGNSNQLTVQGIQGSNVPKIEDKGGKL